MSYERHLSVALIVLGITATACSSDDFVPRGGLADSESGGSTQTAQANVAEDVVAVCTDLCLTRRDSSHNCASQLELNSGVQCDGGCSFLTLVDANCQEALLSAYSCQLDTNPCATGPCDPLLQSAEEGACKDYWQWVAPQLGQ